MFYISKKYLLSIFLILIIVTSILTFKTINDKENIISNTTSKRYVAIVIDDLGDDEKGIEELFNLDIPITVAVMPFMENTKIHTEKAIKAGHEVIIHLPLEPESGQVKWMGPRPIKNNSNNEDINSIMNDAISEIKGAKGINNHMGSKVMKNKKIMEEVLGIVKENNLYFLDSRTGEYSVAEEISKDLKVLYLYRDVFLDNSKNEESIKNALKLLTEETFEKGYAIGIGHVGGQGGKKTIDVIKKMSKEMQDNGIEFVYLSDLFRIFNNFE